jgi:hypothetical protein
MNATPYMLWHPKRSSQGIDSASRMSQDGKFGELKMLTNYEDVIYKQQ